MLKKTDKIIIGKIKNWILRSEFEYCDRCKNRTKQKECKIVDSLINCYDYNSKEWSVKIPRKKRW